MSTLRIHRTTLLVCTLILVAPLKTAAQTGEIHVVGARSIDTSTIRQLARGHADDSAVTRIVRAYASIGYLDARCEVDSTQSLVIVEGRQFHVSSIAIDISDSLRSSVTNAAIGDREQDIVGDPFSAATLEELVIRALHSLTSQGFALAAIDVSLDVESDAATVGIALHVREGPMVRIVGIDVSGNATTRTSLIIAAADLQANGIYTDEVAYRVRQRVDRLGLFTRVDEPVLYAADSSGPYRLRVRVVEGSPNTFDGLIGYQPAGTGGGDATIAGQISIALGNIFGSGRRLSLRWRRQSGTGSQLLIKYVEPYVLDQPMEIDASYAQSLEESSPLLRSYAQRRIECGLTYGFTDAFSARLGGALAWTIPETDTLASCAEQLVRSRLTEATVSIAYDTRSDRLNPVAGLLYGTSYGYGNRVVLGPYPCDTSYERSDPRQRVEVDLESYVPVIKFVERGDARAAGTVVLAGIVRYRETRASNADDADLYRVGGFRSVRGYLDAEFRGSRVAWGSLEGRVVLSDRSYASIFIDGGYVHLPGDSLRPQIPERDSYLLGYGVAAQIDSPIGVMIVTYALGKGDTFETGKVSFGIANQF